MEILTKEKLLGFGADEDLTQLARPLILEGTAQSLPINIWFYRNNNEDIVCWAISGRGSDGKVFLPVIKGELNDNSPIINPNYISMDLFLKVSNTLEIRYKTFSLKELYL